MKNDNKGITMVEIVISFTVLAVVMLVFYNCIKFSGNMMKRAADIDRDNNAFQSATAAYFNDYSLGAGDEATYTFTATDATGSSDSFTENIKYADILFKPDGDSYEVTDSMGEDVRRIRVFSVD